MKSGNVTGLLSGVILAGFSLGAFAETKENPYQVIIDRNPFGLKPVPIVEPPKPPEAPLPPPLDIKLTGITTLLGPPRAFLEFTDPQTKKTDRPSAFAEGDTYKDEITIISIDAANNVVRIKKGDAETTLDFDKNGIKPSMTASAAPVPVPHPNVAPLNLGAPAATLSQPASTGGRSAILGGGTASTVPNYSANPAAAYSAVGGLPARPVRTDAGAGAAILGGYQAPQPVIPAAAPAMSREEAIRRIQAQKEAFQRQGNPAAAILPPVPGAPVPGR